MWVEILSDFQYVVNNIYDVFLKESGLFTNLHVQGCGITVRCRILLQV